MRYEIFGDNLPALEIYLDQGEAVYTQSGGMSWMTPAIDMQTNMNGGLFKGLGRMISGESLFMATYTAQAPDQCITLGSAFPGYILPLEVGPGKEYIFQKSAFMCAQPGVNLSLEVGRGGIKGGLFGGEGFIMQKVTGQGMVFLEIDGSIKEIDLRPGQRLIVDTGSVACFESQVQYSAQMVKGFKNVLFGGEGLFLTTLTGPGKVYLQTMTMPSFASRIVPYLPAGN